MKTTELRTNLDNIRRKYLSDRLDFQKSFAYANNKVVLGDIVTDNIGSIKVERILWRAEGRDGLPSCIYEGQEYTKKGKPFARTSVRQVFQCNLIKRNE